MELVPEILTRWIQINLDHIKHNIAQVKAALGPQTRLMAVVKGDAYGCGSLECAKAAVDTDCSMLGVTTLEEAIELRTGGIDKEILVFSPLLTNEAIFYTNYDLTPTITSKEGLEALAQAAQGKEHKFHIKIETGFGRLGVTPKGIAQILSLLTKNENLKLSAIYTHFAKAFDEGYVKKQVDKLLEAKELCLEKGLKDVIVHACASAGFLKYPHYHFDMVRIGTLIYGQDPAGIQHTLDLKDPWTCKARILQVKKINVGESVGYGRDFVAAKNMAIAILPIGLADGFSLDPPVKAKSFLDLIKIIVKEILKFTGKPHNLSGTVSYNGNRLPLIGRIGMQLAAVDVTNVNVERDAVVDIGIRRTAASARIARVYIHQEKLKNIRSIMGAKFNEVFFYRGGKA